MMSQVQEVPSLQLRVLQNHNPLTDSIICIAPFVVVYTFSLETETWAKANIEGTLFVTELLPSTLNPSQPRYSLVVLNQRNLENFTYSIKKAEHVELADEDFISLTEMHDQGRGDTVKTIWGLGYFPIRRLGRVKRGWQRSWRGSWGSVRRKWRWGPPGLETMTICHQRRNEGGGEYADRAVRHSGHSPKPPVPVAV